VAKFSWVPSIPLLLLPAARMEPSMRMKRPWPRLTLPGALKPRSPPMIPVSAAAVAY